MALEFLGGCMGGKIQFYMICRKERYNIIFVSGAAGVLAGYPLDTVKVRIQTSPAGTYKGTFDCLLDCVR